MAAPANDDLANAEELDFVNLRRRFRSTSGTTVDATTETDENLDAVFGGIPFENTVWYTFQVDAGTTGVHRIQFTTQDPVRVQARLYRQQGTGFAGLQIIDHGEVFQLVEHLHLNCEGYNQGRSGDWFWEFAVAGDERYYIQVATTDQSPGNRLDGEFGIEWYYDPWDPPHFIAGNKISSPCRGVALATYGFEIRYFAPEANGWPQRFLAGSSDHVNLPDLPVDGHAFYVERVAEGLNVHIQRIVVGWTEAFGPFYYACLEPEGKVRTWTVDNEDPDGDGIGDGVGGLYMPIFFYDNIFEFGTLGANAAGTIRTFPHGARTEVDLAWGQPMPAAPDNPHAPGALAWGPGRPGSIFAFIVPELGAHYTVEYNLDGTVAATYPLTDFIWPTFDGTELVGVAGFGVLGARTVGDTEQQGNNETLLGSYIPELLDVAAGDLLFALTIADWNVTVSYNDFTGTQPWTKVHDVILDTARFCLWTRTATVLDVDATVTSHGAWVTSATSHSSLAEVVNCRDAELASESYSVAAAATSIDLPSVGGPSGAGLLLMMFGGQVGDVSHITRPIGTTAAASPLSANGSSFSDVDTEAVAASLVIGPGSTPALTATSTEPASMIAWAISLSGPGVGDLLAYNMAAGGTRVVRRGVGGVMVGVRSNTGEAVLTAQSITPGGASMIRCVDTATGALRLLTAPPRPLENPPTWNRNWNSMGVTGDGHYLFLSMFYPLTEYVSPRAGNRDFVTDVWWIDLDTGAYERKFIMAEPFHDTDGVFDKAFEATATPVGRRLYKQSDVGGN